MLGFYDSFQDISATDTRLRHVALMNDRERLIFLFHNARLPLSVRKYLVSRIRKFHAEKPLLDLSKRDGKARKLTIPQKATAA